MQGELAQMISEIVANVILGVLTLILFYVLSYIKQATARIRSEVEEREDAGFSNMIWQALDRVDHLATITVQAIEQTVARDLREKVAIGEINKEKLSELADKAYDDIMNMLEDEYKDTLFFTIGDVEKYVTNVIESKVAKVKTGQI